MNSKSSQKIVLTTAQILEAYEAHGNDFIVINLDTARKFKSYAQYIDISVKLADGTISPVRYWKISNDGMVVASRIAAPEQRKYENIRVGFALYDEETGDENENCKAIKLLCDAFAATMEKLKDEKMVTDDAKAPRKQADGTFRPFHLISTKAETPMQTSAKDRETDEFVDLENPRFWISLPKRRFYKAGETPYPSVHFDDKYYIDSETGLPDAERPVMTHVYAVDMYNVDDWYHHPRTGKKIYKKLGAINEDDDIILDNTNIQDYLTRGSAIMGNLKFEVAVNARQCKIDIALYGRCYVKRADIVEGVGGADEEDVESFSKKHESLAQGNGDAIPDDDDCFDGEE